jgi:acetyl-CoA acetyltransferase
VRTIREAAVAGTYLSRQGDHSDRPQAGLWWECARGACADAGLSLGDIDGMVGAGPEGTGIRALLPGAGLGYDLLGKPLRFHASAFIGAASTGAAIYHAVSAVSQGLANVVLVCNAAAGEVAGYASADRDQAVAAMSRLGGPYEYVHGTTRPADFAVLARRHMYRFGTTSEQLAEVAVAQRHAATLHPLSLHGHRGELTIDEVVGSRMIADPLRLLDCCPVNQGGAALVVTAADAVRGATGRPAIGLLGYAEGHSHIDANAAPDLATFPAAAQAADRAFAMAGVRRDDVDVAGISDHCTANVIFGLESAGFCEPGDGGPFVEGGATGLGGRLPVNTAGGFLSFSHAGHCGIFTLIEVVQQLWGEAGPRQVPNARVGYVDGVGGAMQNSFSALLGAVA